MRKNYLTALYRGATVCGCADVRLGCVLVEISYDREAPEKHATSLQRVQQNGGVPGADGG